MKQIDETRNWFFEKNNKSDDNPLARLIKKKGWEGVGGKTQIDKLKNERGEITTNATEI